MRQLLSPYKFQQDIIDRASLLRHFAFLMDMGTGKTLTSINVVRNQYKIHQGMIQTLVICPIIVLDNWKAEFLMSTQLAPELIGVCNNPDIKKRLKVINDPRHKVIVINYEALLNQQIVEALCRRQFGVAIADEAHKLRNHNGKIFKAAFKVATSCQHRYILTGTPVGNSIMDIWAQFYWMDSGETFGNSYQVFRGYYMEDENREWAQSEVAAGIPRHMRKAFPKWVVRPYMMDEFRAKLSRVSARVTTEEAVDLPEYVSNVVRLEMSAEQSEHYNRARIDLVTWLKDQPDNPLVLKNALTKLLRLNEICSGYMKLEDGSIHVFKDNPKARAVEELLESMEGHKVIIFCIYSEDYIVLRELLTKLGKNFVEITGEIDTEEKLQNARSMQNLDGEVEIAICNTKAAGIGINLVGAKYKIYWSRNFSYIDYIQSIKRNLRAGAVKFHKTLVDYQLCIKDTVCEKTYNRLIEKKKFADDILDSKKDLHETFNKQDLIDLLS